MLALIAYLLPDLVLRLQGRDRQQAIQTALPDVLDQMSISVEAGLGFDAALGRVVESGRGPLVDELQRTLREIAIGVPRKQAFRNLVERTDVPELRHFVFAVNQAEEYGLPIAQVLRVQSKELRVIRRQRAEERAMKLPVKIVFPLVFCIFPALFVVLLVPAAIRIFEARSEPAAAQRAPADSCSARPDGRHQAVRPALLQVAQTLEHGDHEHVVRAPQRPTRTTPPGRSGAGRRR